MLFGQTRSRLLSLLYGSPGATFYVRQLSRQIGGSVGTVQRELATLAQIGLLVRTQSGHQVLYRANREHPAYTEMRALLAKTNGTFELFRGALSQFEPKIEFAFVYGSFARAEENAASDIDLMVVGEVTLDELLELLTPVESKMGRPINPTVYAREELRTKLRSANHFLKAVQSAPLVFLVGEEHEFREIR